MYIGRETLLYFIFNDVKLRKFYKSNLIRYKHANCSTKILPITVRDNLFLFHHLRDDNFLTSFGIASSLILVSSLKAISMNVLNCCFAFQHMYIEQHMYIGRSFACVQRVIAYWYNKKVNCNFYYARCLRNISMNVSQYALVRNFHLHIIFSRRFYWFRLHFMVNIDGIFLTCMNWMEHNCYINKTRKRKRSNRKLKPSKLQKMSNKNSLIRTSSLSAQTAQIDENSQVHDQYTREDSMICKLSWSADPCRLRTLWFRSGMVLSC